MSIATTKIEESELAKLLTDSRAILDALTPLGGEKKLPLIRVQIGFSIYKVRQLSAFVPETPIFFRVEEIERTDDSRGMGITPRSIVRFIPRTYGDRHMFMCLYD